MITNQLDAPPPELIDRHFRRTVIDNAIADAIGFLHMDALAANAPMRIDGDLRLTVKASTLNRIWANVMRDILLGIEVGGNRRTSEDEDSVCVALELLR